jgi:hypothetical protein
MRFLKRFPTDIVDILRVKKSLAPESAPSALDSSKPPTKERRKRKITSAGEVPEEMTKSAPTVEDSDPE